VSGHRAVRKHEATLEMDRERTERAGKTGDGDTGEGVVALHHRSRQARACRGTDHEVDVVPTVEANGNDPISPLSVAAEPALCLSK
jgi:hypothetical protein